MQVAYAATDVAYMLPLLAAVHAPLPGALQGTVAKVSGERARWYERSAEDALFDGEERAAAPIF